MSEYNYGNYTPLWTLYTARWLVYYPISSLYGSPIASDLRGRETPRGYRHDAINRLCNNYNLSSARPGRNNVMELSVCFSCVLNTATNRGLLRPTRTTNATTRPFLSKRKFEACRARRAGSRQSRSHDTKTIIYRDFSLLQRKPTRHEARSAGYFISAIRIPRSRLRATREDSREDPSSPASG